MQVYALPKIELVKLTSNLLGMTKEVGEPERGSVMPDSQH